MNKRSTLIAWAVAACLSACGGGGSTDSTTPAGSNTAPVANAGPTQSVMTGTTVTLNASASTDANGDALTYQWTLDSKPAGSAAQLSSATAVMPTLSADVAGSYVFSLTVNDGKTVSAGSNVTVTAAVTNAAPVANAGPAQNVTTGTSVTLDGSGSSDVNGDALTYAWTLSSRPTGSIAVLNSTNSAKPSFTADVAGPYVVTLIVNDGLLNSSAATVTLTAAAANVAPIAYPDPFSPTALPVGTVVAFNGSNSIDANGDSLTYSWNLITKPVNSIATLNGASTARPTLTIDAAGTYVASLVVNDGRLSSQPTNVTVIAGIPNTAPIANAGTTQNVTTGSLVTLDGSASSDANGDPLSYSWTLTSKPTGSTAVLSSATSARTNLIADAAGTYVGTLVVNDGKLNSTAATVAVSAVAPKLIGIPYLARNGMTVTLESFTVVDLGNGYTRYYAAYYQENNTSASIDEATLRLYFTNDVPAAQYGAFGRILPGVGFGVRRSYTFDVVTTSIPQLLQYDANHFFANQPVAGALQWQFPIR